MFGLMLGCRQRGVFERRSTANCSCDVSGQRVNIQYAELLLEQLVQTYKS